VTNFVASQKTGGQIRTDFTTFPTPALAKVTDCWHCIKQIISHSKCCIMRVIDVTVKCYLFVNIFKFFLVIFTPICLYICVSLRMCLFICALFKDCTKRKFAIPSFSEFDLLSVNMTFLCCHFSCFTIVVQTASALEEWTYQPHQEEVSPSHYTLPRSSSKIFISIFWSSPKIYLTMSE